MMVFICQFYTAQNYIYSLTLYSITISTVQFSCSVVCDILRPHGLQHASRHYPSPILEFTQTHVH